MFSVCILCYGNYPELIQRCLTSLAGSRPPAGFISDLRIGCNEISSQSRETIFDFSATWPTPVYVYTPLSGNVGKYPLMRRLFYDPDRPLAARVMWFDDDSYIDQSAGETWWRQVEAQSSNVAQLGSIHRWRCRWRQAEGLNKQPWMRQRVAENFKFPFCVGGWWVSHSRLFSGWDYPFPYIHHNGGDTLLSLLLQQQGGELKSFSLAFCHCEVHGKSPRKPPQGCVHVNVGGRTGRRGLGRSNEKQPWRGDDSLSEIISRHNFSCEVVSFNV